MSTAPNCNKNAARARLRRAAFLAGDKEASSWKRTLEANRYPKCVGKKLFDDCPEKAGDNPPSGCRACPQYVPSKEDIRQRMLKLMAEIKK